MNKFAPFYYLCFAFSMEAGIINIATGVGYTPPLMGNFVIGVTCLSTALSLALFWRRL